MQMGVTDASSLIELQMVLQQITDPGDYSSTNLETITTIFHVVAENNSIRVDNDAFQSATNILSQIQSWGMDSTTRATLQNDSAE